MNERIIRLAQEAGMYVDLNGNPWPKWMSAEECELAYKKFAELIVKECARVAFESDLTMAIGQWGADSAILKHFGVEE